MVYTKRYKKGFMANMAKHKKTLFALLAVYVLSAVTSFALFFYLAPTSSAGPSVVQNDTEELTRLGALLEIDPSEPRDQPCPLNGQLYTMTERRAWETRRPLAVMIENAPDARPQSGLSQADITYEIVAEGGVTRFMSFFYCDAQLYDVTIAPVRSARSYFVDYASGYHFPLYVNVGGANLPGPTDALGQINQYGWAMQNNLNQFSVGFPTFVRNQNRLGRAVATEHTMETTTEKLWAVAEDRGWTNTSPPLRVGRQVYPEADWNDLFEPWQYQDEVPSPGDVREISHGFWSGYGQYNVVWEYNPETNGYLRSMGGEPHIDLNTDQQIEINNVIVLFTRERGPINELKHMIYQTTGTGNALIFKNGMVERATWSKEDREDELRFYDRAGDEVVFARGPIWISVVDVNTNVEY